METTECQCPKGKNWVGAMALCWALGAMGAHRFYTGKTGSAWAMLVMTITGCLAPISALWAVIDGIMLALGKYTSEDGSELYERIPLLGYLYIAMIVLGAIGAFLYFTMFAAIIGAAATSGAAAVPPVTP